MSWTQISFSKMNEQIGSHMWRKVWHDQLQLASVEEFWNGLQGGEVRYNVPPAPEPPEPLPRYLEAFLRDVEHLTPDQIAATSVDEAKALWLAYHSRELYEP